MITLTVLPPANLLSWGVAYKQYVYPPTRDFLLGAYEQHFESCFILLHPFVRVDEELGWQQCRQYPNDAAILSSGAKCSWAELARLANIRNCASVSRALLTSIGAIEDFLADHATRDQLQQVLEANPVWMPTEGRFEPLLQADLLALFNKAGHREVVFVPEFAETDPVEVFSIADLQQGRKGFPERGSLLAPDESLLATVDWDSFFTLLYGPHTVLSEFTASRNLEGFFAEPETEHFWFNWKMGCATCTVSPKGWG